MNKYEVVPGLWIGSEMGDLNREMKLLLSKVVKGESTLQDENRIKEIRDRRIRLLTGKINEDRI